MSTSGLDIGIHGGDPEKHFEVFFAVDDLAASTAKVTELGGRLIGEVHADAGFGKWIECADDQGVRFGLRQS